MVVKRGSHSKHSGVRQSDDAWFVLYKVENTRVLLGFFLKNVKWVVAWSTVFLPAFLLASESWQKLYFFGHFFNWIRVLQPKAIPLKVSDHNCVGQLGTH